MRAKVNITLTVRSSVYQVLHKPLLIYVGRVAQCSCRFQLYMLLLPKFKKIRPRIWNKCLGYPDSNATKTCFQIHSILIGDKKLSCFEALILIIPEKNHQIFSWIVDVPYQ